MAATRTNNTFVEELAGLMHKLADMKLLPDADMPMLIDMETKIIQKARAPEARMQQAGLIPPGGQNPMGNAALGLPGLPPMGGAPPPSPGDMPGMAPPPSFLGAGGVPGMNPSPPMPQSSAEVAALMGVAA